MKGRILAFVGRTLLGLRYRVRIIGMEEVLAKGRTGILLLPNHPAYVDPAILLTHFLPALAPRTLADQDNMARPWLRWIIRRVGVRPIPDPALHGEASLPEVARVLRESAEDLARGGNVMLYPAGHIMLGRQEDLGGNSAVETILSGAPGARVVLVRTTGLWGSSFSRASGRRPDLGAALVHGLRSLLAGGLLFCPRREVRIELLEPADLPRGEGRMAMNRFMEATYNLEAPAARYVPYTPWERGGARELPEPEARRVEGNLDEVPASIREQLQARLSELTGGSAFADGALLARDLGLDSLARMELQLWIEHAFGFEVPDPEMLQTVGDCLLAASGKAAGPTSSALKPPPSAWFRPGPAVEVPEGETLATVFLGQASRGAGRPALADLQGGVKTYRDLVTAILVLKPRFEALEGDHVGIMLPASGAAAVVYLAAVFAGKIPVMVNWTAGSRNLAHALDLLGVRHVLTSSQLVQKVEAMGSDLSAVKDRFLLMEDLGRTLTRGEKLKAFLGARVSWGSLRRARIRDTAVVLFTSGSESLPKAVPLSHRNILANIRDLVGIFPLEPTERMVGFLPPFHSFGLTGTLLLPLCAGVPVVYFPNPTDGGALARLVEAYRVTMLVGTPTFLSGIVRSATDANLATLRMVVAGAEKCPESLFATLERRWPGMRVLEGYGITECSPVLSVNPFEDPRKGTIGRLLPSLEQVILDPETGVPVPPFGTGMLLVRGPSVFAGYLHYHGEAPYVVHDGRSWYRTGDLVREEADGYLVFAGRLKRFVKLGGEMISLPAVEEALLGAFGREEDREIPLAVEATPTEGQPELVLFTVRPLGREEANGALARAGLSPLHFIRQVRLVDAIPMLGTGKTDYRGLKALLA